MCTPIVTVIIPTYNRREDVCDCVASILKSTWSDREIVVVDNGSDDGTCEALHQRFAGAIRVIRSEVNLYAGGGRNLGAAQAHGKWLLFVDSDNVVAPDMIERLLEGAALPHGERLGLCGPLMYYADDPDRICLTGGTISLWTSLTHWTGNGEKDTGQYWDIACLPTGHIPNLFMIRKCLFEELGGFEAGYGMHYEESDLAERVKRRGLECLFFPKAKTWHKIPSVKPKGDKQYDGRHEALLFHSVRNRIWFMKRFASRLQIVFFFFIFGPLLLFYQMAMCAWNGHPMLMKILFRGCWEGWSRGLPAVETGVKGGS